MRFPAMAFRAVLAAAGFIPSLAAQMSAPPSSAAPAAVVPAGSAFTFQGVLADGAVASGPYDLQFALFDAATAGNQIGSLLLLPSHPVTNGVFSAVLDFGPSVFGGGARFLRVAGRPGGSAAPFALLGPRREIRPTPMALSLPNVYTDEASSFVGIGRSVRVSGNEVFGVRAVTNAADYGGMYAETESPLGRPQYGYSTGGVSRVRTFYDPTSCLPPDCETPDYGGWTLVQQSVTRLQTPLAGGLRVGPAEDYSVRLANSAGSDGVRIYDTGDDGIQVGSDPDYPSFGLYIPSPGVPTYGIWPNTSQAAGEWALFTSDKIESSNVFTAGLTQIARVAPGSVLRAGDVVAALGAAAGAPGTGALVPTVVAAGEANREAVVGVVGSRMALVSRPGKSGEDGFALHSVEGDARPGDFVAVVVQGVTRVRVDADGLLASGARLTASREGGSARPLRSRDVDGMRIAESAFAFAVALGTRDEDGLALAYVRSR
jgi:hypothetical protein